MSRFLRLASRMPRPLRRAVKRLPMAERLRSTLAGDPRTVHHEPGTRRPVVYLPTWARWDEMRQRPQYVLGALAAAGHPVFFVDPREPTSRTVDGVQIVPSLAGVPANDAILYLHFAPLVTMIDKFSDPVVIYDILDDLAIYDADEVDLPFERTVRHHHPTLMERADIVIASNEVLTHRHGHERSDIVLVGNGVNVDRFARPVQRPADIPEDRPVIGYHGAVAEWFDFPLFERVARSMPDVLFAVVGPIAPAVAKDAARLEQLGNVAMLGERAPDAMPGYVQAFDVGTVWFEVTHMTEGVTPLKVYEYLAAGVPVVSTPLPSCVEEPAVATAADPADFASSLRRALHLGEDAAWRAQAAVTVAEADWRARIVPLVDRLDDIDGGIVQ